MELNFDNILRLKHLRLEKSRLSEEEAFLSKPVLDDISLMDKIHSELSESLSGIEKRRNVRKSYLRKIELFIVLYLYSPSSLAGGRLPSGLRVVISKIMNVPAGCVISNDIADAYFMYKNCRDFRGDVEYLFPKVMAMLTR